MNEQELIIKLSIGAYDNTFVDLYQIKDIDFQRARYIRAVEKFSGLNQENAELRVFSAPGRTEIGGNHTDHQNGCVFAAAIDRDIIGVAGFHDKGYIRIRSEGYDEFTVYLDDLEVHKDQSGPSEIVRGIAAGFKKRGIDISGFNMYVNSNIPEGSGMSSSAAFETLIATALNASCGNALSRAETAKICQYAENVYFGKSCGLMDQTVAAEGGLVFIDFKNADAPEARNIAYDLAGSGYDMVITDTKGSHSDLTVDYDAVRAEMEECAAYFDKKVLSEVDEELFLSRISELRKTVSDRAILRAAHFFSDSKRAAAEADVLEKGEFEKFLLLINESGESSSCFLQNMYSLRRPEEQGIPLAVMISKKILAGKGAVRVHGGGFAGTVLAFVPSKMTKNYISEMDSVFGKNSGCRMKIRPVGGIELM